jgi:hypothetical protein
VHRPLPCSLNPLNSRLDTLASQNLPIFNLLESSANRIGSYSIEERLRNDPGADPATVYVEMPTLRDSLADSSIFLLPRQIAGTPRETWRSLRIVQAGGFCFLVSHIGTEIALGKIKTNSKCLIVSVIGRTIHFRYEGFR